MLDRVRIVLVNPQLSGNVGGVARAMRNTGLDDLVVVAPAAYDPEEARWMAPGCGSLLAKAKIVATMDEALSGAHHVVAATARHRRLDQPVHTPARLAQQVADGDGVYAILFGREDHGLSNADVLHAEAVLRIPTPEHASLNLAQAVLVTSYALFTEAMSRGTVAAGRTLAGSGKPSTTRNLDKRVGRDRADVAMMEPAAEAIVQMLDRVGYMNGTSPDRVRLTMRQALQSAGPSTKEVRALLGMVKQVHWKLDHPDD
jgi:TrmH family RNA methyltransferase